MGMASRRVLPVNFRALIFIFIGICFKCNVCLNVEVTPEEFEIHMPGVHPKKDDQYICVAGKVPAGQNYITEYEALASAGTAHHLLVYGCKTPHQEQGTWNCASLCQHEGPKIMFAWAKNAPPTRLPKDVGFEVGGSSKINYIVLQIHYRSAFKTDDTDDTSGVRFTFTPQPQLFAAGVTIMMTSHGLIRAHAKKVHADISCQYKGATDLHPFAFRTHAHDLSTVISGYLYNHSYTMIGKGSPQWPQAFYNVENPVTIKHNDWLVARCTYDASERDRDTRIGSTHLDEMCNFYFMYYTDRSTTETFIQCIDNAKPALLEKIPAGNDVPPEHMPTTNDKEALDEEDDDTEEHEHHHTMPGVDDGSDTDMPVATHHDKESSYTEVANWPHIVKSDKLKLGQVAGVAVDSKGNVHVFHRGDREWDNNSFDYLNNFLSPEKPIAQNVLVTFSSDGKVIDQWGKDMFFMPHGIFIDKEDNIWVTDVAMHQVFRFPPDSHTADRMLGTRMEPGNDVNHFCKPTDVTVIDTGDVFITDGYCNNRVMKVSADGQFIKQWGSASIAGVSPPAPSSFNLPHSITNLPQHQMVCVADRENKRVQCFDYEGIFQKQYQLSDINAAIFAVDYCPDQDVLLLVTDSKVYALEVETGHVLTSWAPLKQGFSRPHDLIVANNGRDVYVTEIGPNKVWKFTVDDHKDVSSKVSHPHSVDASSDESAEKQIEDTEEADFGASVVIGALLVIPVLIIVLIVTFLRMRKKRIDDIGYKLVMPEESESDSEAEQELFIRSRSSAANKHVTFLQPRTQ